MRTGAGQGVSVGKEVLVAGKIVLVMDARRGYLWFRFNHCTYRIQGLNSDAIYGV